MILTLVSGCALIMFCLVLFVDTPSFFGLQVFQPKTPLNSVEVEPIEAPEVVEVKEIPDPEEMRNISSMNEAIQELEDLGCTVTLIERLEGFSDETGMLLSYQEFKKIAIREEIIFQYTV
jgi:hypothetical protein